MNTTRALLVLATMVLVLFVPAMVFNVSGMDHQASVSTDPGTWAMVLALVLAWFGAYMAHWFKCQAKR